MAKKDFGAPGRELAVNGSGDAGVAGKATSGVQHSTNRTVSKRDDPLAKMSPTGRSGRAGKKRSFSKLAIKAAIHGGHH